ncbi:butyrophilin subfamily 1 member A1-like [Antechinus flavipes]|uniref:butyrophilin subfamily 1 member A1-like n=1 Tax=Antechinus flavipes TaxID=38775 RepID=UPI002235B517|nr:butyrophilin subfamily 1 member A1-like [Antechinus flavipes]
MDERRHGPLKGLSLPSVSGTGYTRYQVPGKFTVIGPQQPIIAIVGREAIFPCHLSPQINAQDMDVIWFYGESSQVVHRYKYRQDYLNHQHQHYKGRTEFLRDYISIGSVALKICHIQASDEGKYRCFFETPYVYEEAEFQVFVAGKGSAPHIYFTSDGNKSFRLVCTSTGWYPKPEVHWRKNQEKLLSQYTTIKKKENGLFSVETSIMVSTNSTGNVSCFIWNSLLRQKLEATISVSDDLFPHNTPWRVIWIVTVVLFSIVILIIIFVTWKLKKGKGKDKSKCGLFQHEAEPRDTEIENTQTRAIHLSMQEVQRALITGPKSHGWQQAKLNFWFGATELQITPVVELCKMVFLSLREIALILLFQLPWLFLEFYQHSKDFCYFLKDRNGVSSGSKEFTVLGPQQPIKALLGEEVTFHCGLWPQKNAGNMEVMWFHEKPSNVIHHYKDRQDQKYSQLPKYTERTKFLQESISRGNVALRLSNIHLSDEGKYFCQFTSSIYSDKAEFQVYVAGMGSDLNIHSDIKGFNIRLTCTSTGWYPKPEVQWRNSHGKPLPPASENVKQEDNGLFFVKSSILVLANSEETFSCVIRNPLLNQQKEVKVFLADNLFSTIPYWTLFFFGFVAIIFVHYFKYNEILRKLRDWASRTLERIEWNGVQKWVNPGNMQKEQSRIKPSFLFHHEEVQEGDQKKMEGNLSPFTDTLKRPDLQAAQKYRVDVTLDADTAGPFFLPRRHRKSIISVPHKNNHKNNGVWEIMYCVLGKERFTSGRCYWEVQVEDTLKWTVGLCKDSVVKKNLCKVTPGTGFWTIFLENGNKYWALSNRPICLHLEVAPKVVGIFLDYEAGCISFYNVTDDSHIYTFQGTFREALRPCINPLTLLP